MPDEQVAALRAALKAIHREAEFVWVNSGWGQRHATILAGKVRELAQAALHPEREKTK